MDRVNIVLMTNCKGAGKQKAVGMYLIEKIHDGIPTIKCDYLKRESITSKELTLQLLANAIYVINHIDITFESIEVYTDENYVVSAFKNKWINKWDAENWINAKGKETAHADTWKMVLDLMGKSGKTFIFTQSRSSWDGWMRAQIQKEVEK